MSSEAGRKLDRVDEIDIDRVRRVALLSRLDLTEEETRQYARELTEILVHINKLGALDLTDVPPTSHAIPVRNVFREDRTRAGLLNEEALANAPESEDHCFKVPQII